MSGGWWLVVGGGFSGSYSWKTYMWPFLVAAWLSHSLVARFKGQVSRENQVGLAMHFIHWSWKSRNITCTVVKSLPRCEEREHKPYLLVERCQCPFKGRAYRMVCTGTVIFGKYNLPQSWKGRSFRIAHLESTTALRYLKIFLRTTYINKLGNTCFKCQFLDFSLKDCYLAAQL